MTAIQNARHPAVYSDEVILAFKQYLPDFLPDGATILDPFAGSGKIHFLRPQYKTFGIELEPEWAAMSEYTFVGDARYPDKVFSGKFNAVVTSPVYGNRMSDHFEAKDNSKRVTYRDYLGRPLSEGSTGKMQWGKAYREFHKLVWIKMLDMLVEEPLFVLNVSNHIRNFQEVKVAEWHRDTLIELGWVLKEALPIITHRMGFGDNRDARAEEEWVYFFTR